MSLLNNGNNAGTILGASILGSMNGNAANAGAKPEKKVADFWINIGINVPNADGSTTFVSLPMGLALDDMKPQAVRGSNADWIALAQTKNALLEQIKRAAATLEPGARTVVPVLQVELHRRAEPAQEGSVGDNPLMGSLMATLAGTAQSTGTHG